MKNYFLMLIAFFGITVSSYASGDKLVIFINDEDTKVSKSFQSELPKIREMAAEMDLKVVTIQASSGVPLEVGALPAIYLYDGAQALYYKGQYTATDRLKAFLQNANRFDFDGENQLLESVMVSEFERFTKVTRLKVTDVKFEAKSDAEEIAEPLKNAIAQTANFAFHDRFMIHKQAKIHYLDLYPYKSADGVYYINTAVFSQHNCVQPLFKSSEPFSGKDIVRLGQDIGAWYANFELELYQNTENGDGLDVIKDLPVKTWETLGFPMLKSSDSKNLPSVNLESGTMYFHPQPKERPVVFSFSPPLSNYNGSASTVYGAMVYNDDNLKGEFGVVLESITMGDDLLDESVKGHQLQTPKYPTVTFQFDKKVSVSSGSSFKVNGKLNLLGSSRSQEADVVLFKDAQSGKWTLDASLQIDIGPFPSLERPDGQAPLNHTVFISVKCMLDDKPVKVVIPQPVKESKTSNSDSQSELKSELIIPANSYVAKDGEISFKTDKFNVNGSTGKVKAFLAPNDVVYAEVDLNTLIFKKGATMKKHAIGEEGLHAALHPIAKFSGKIVSGYDAGKTGEQNIEIVGELNLHGVKLEQELSGVLKIEGSQITVKTTIPIERLKFGLNGKKASSIDEVVKVRVEITMEKDQ